MSQKLVGKIARAANALMGPALGIAVRKAIRPSPPGTKIPHQSVFPYATYAPWAASDTFQNVYRIAKDYTLADEYRLYELYALARQATRFGGDFLEVGVWRAGSSAVIQAAIEDAPSDRRPKFSIADTFTGVVKAGSAQDNHYENGEHADTSVPVVRELFSKTGLKEPDILVGIFPDDHPDLNIEKISFLHSDVDAYQSTKDIIAWCLPRLTEKAIIVFDDYGFQSCEGVTTFVNEFMEQHGDRFVLIHNLNGHAVLVKN